MCIITFSKSVINIGSIETKKMTFSNKLIMINIQRSTTGTSRSGLLYLKLKHQKDLAKCVIQPISFINIRLASSLR